MNFEALVRKLIKAISIPHFALTAGAQINAITEDNR